MTSICDRRHVARTRAVETRDLALCTCGVLRSPRIADDLVEDDPHRALADTLAELALARRHVASERERFRVVVGPLVNPIARLQGAADGSERDATEQQVSALWDRVQTPETRVGQRMREHFLDALVRHCEEDAPREVCLAPAGT